MHNSILTNTTSIRFKKIMYTNFNEEKQKRCTHSDHFSKRIERPLYYDDKICMSKRHTHFLQNK